MNEEYDELPPATFSVNQSNNKLTQEWSAQVECSFDSEGRGKNMQEAQGNLRTSLSDFVGRLATETVEHYG